MTHPAPPPDTETISARATIGAIVLGGSYGSLAVVRSLGRQGVPVAYFSSQQSVAQYSRYLTHHIEWAGTRGPAALEKLLEVSNRLGLNGWVLLPSSDLEVQFVTQNYDALAQHFALVTMPWSSLERLNDKGQLYRLAETLGIDYPRVYWDGDVHMTPAGNIRFPVVIKPASTEKSNPLTKAKAWRAETLPEYEEKFAQANSYMGPKGFVVQELIPGGGDTQFSYAGLWDHGREVCGLTARRSRQFPAEFGTSPFVEVVEQADVTIEARALLSAVNYHGLVEVEFKLDRRDDRLKLLDVNTRIWAWIGLGAAAGLDFPMLAMGLATQGPSAEVGAVTYGVSWLHPISNALSLLQSLLRQGRLGYAGRRSLLQHSVSSVYAADDMRPPLAELWVQLVRWTRGLFRR